MVTERGASLIESGFYHEKVGNAIVSMVIVCLCLCPTLVLCLSTIPFSLDWENVSCPSWVAGQGEIDTLLFCRTKREVNDVGGNVEAVMVVVALCDYSRWVAGVGVVGEEHSYEVGGAYLGVEMDAKELVEDEERILVGGSAVAKGVGLVVGALEEGVAPPWPLLVV